MPVAPPTSAGSMTGTLHVHQPHDGDQIAHVETRRGGVEPAIARGRTGGEGGGQTFGVLMDQLAPGELVEKRGACRHGGKITGPMCARDHNGLRGFGHMGPREVL